VNLKGREQADSASPLVSIVVPARNEARSIGACLEALLGQEYPVEKLEILLVDAESTDDTVGIAQAVSNRDPRVRLLTNPERVTPAGFNRGLRVARGEILGVMSAHGIAAPDYVARAVSALVATGAWAVGGRIRRSGTSSVQRAIARVTSSPFGVGDATHNYQDKAGWVDTAFPGLWPRWVFERVGLFDQELVRNQDDELSDRIAAAGGRIWYDPAIVVDYTPRAGYVGLFNQYRQYAMWKVRVFQKHPDAARLRHLIPAIWVGGLTIGLLAAAVTPVGIVLVAGATLPYAAIMSVAAWRLREPATRWFDLFRAFLTLHLAYGLGFWQGLIRFAPRWIRDRRGAVEYLGDRA
jgi:succinoglycan biosynthesis protein ExoA